MGNRGEADMFLIIFVLLWFFVTVAMIVYSTIDDYRDPYSNYNC